MKHLKKYLAALCGFGLAMAVPVTSHAFTSRQVVTETASATITGGSVAMSVAILNVAGNTPATTVGWTAAAGASWTEANQYVQIVSTLTQSGSGIQTYTDNTGVGGETPNPKYTGVISSVTVSPAGLINTVTTNATPIPTAWQIVALGNSPVAPDNPDCTGAVSEPSSCGSPTGQTGYAWFYHEDKAQVPNNAGVATTFANAAPYIEMEVAGQPPQIQFAQGSFGNSTSNTNNVYLEANFQNGLGGQTYQTSTLTVELFTP